MENIPVSGWPLTLHTELLPMCSVEHILHWYPLANWLGWAWKWLCPTLSDSFQTGFDTSLQHLTKILLGTAKRFFFLMFLISKSVQKNTWSQYQTTLLLSTMSWDCPRNPATPGRLNRFPCYKNFCVLNKKWVGNHHSMWLTSIKPPLHFPWNGCLRKIRQHAALRTDYEERQEH